MADDEPSVLINYERESIHAGDDPIPLTIEFPARVTITDLLVTFAERQSRFLAYRRGKSTWQIWHIPDNEKARRVIGLGNSTTSPTMPNTRLSSRFGAIRIGDRR
jgi:hypothetical protein